MKIYISADIEGVTCTAHWDETNKVHADYAEFRNQMTDEVIAACKGAKKAGAKEIWIQDAHGTGRNIILEKLPEDLETVKLVRGWSGHPFGMVQNLDKSFDAVLMIGYHSPSGYTTNPLSHTITGRANYIKFNGKIVSEFLLYTYAAALVNTPVVFVSGDEGLCSVVKELNSNIRTVGVKTGIGDSIISIPPKVALNKIREGVEAALKGDIASCKVELPKHFSVEINYKDFKQAYKNSYYPNVRLIEPQTLVFESDDYFEVLRLMTFVIW